MAANAASKMPFLPGAALGAGLGALAFASGAGSRDGLLTTAGSVKLGGQRLQQLREQGSQTDDCPGSKRERLTFGLEKHGLREFAKAMGAGTWRDAPDPDQWYKYVIDKALNPDVDKLFLLEEVKAWEGVSRASRGGNSAGPTDKELFFFYRHPYIPVQWNKGTPGKFTKVGRPF